MSCSGMHSVGSLLALCVASCCLDAVSLASPLDFFAEVASFGRFRSPPHPETSTKEAIVRPRMSRNMMFRSGPRPEPRVNRRKGWPAGNPPNAAGSDISLASWPLVTYDKGLGGVKCPYCGSQMLASAPALTGRELGVALGLSASRVARVFKAEMGMSLVECKSSRGVPVGRLLSYDLVKSSRVDELELQWPEANEISNPERSRLARG